MKLTFSILFIFLSSVSFSKTITTLTNGYVESVEVLKKYVTQNVPKSCLLYTSDAADE